MLPVANAAVVLLLAASLAVWIAVVGRLLRGRPLVDYQPRCPVPWSMLELALVVCLYLFMASVVIGAAGLFTGAPSADAAPEAPSSSAALLAAAQIVAGLTTVALSVAAVKWGCHASWPDLGWQPAQLRNDLWLGFQAYLAVAPPVFALQWVLIHWIPYQHPVLTALEESPSPGLFLLMGLAAVAVAPLAEELFFRVLLQGWLENHGALAPASIDGEPALAAPWWPLFVVSGLFALTHYSHGPAPVPLFFLSLAMGYLYRQTHRLAPPLALHVCFNATSLIALALGQAEPAAGG